MSVGPPRISKIRGCDGGSVRYPGVLNFCAYIRVRSMYCRTSEPIGFLHWENGQPSLNLAEPAIVGVYRAVRMRHAPGRPLDRVLLWEPREPRP